MSNPRLESVRGFGNEWSVCIMTTVGNARPLHFLQIRYTAKRGFYMGIKADTKRGADQQAAAAVPKQFIPLQCRGKKETNWTTHELMALNARLQSASHDCLILTFQVIAFSNMPDRDVHCGKLQLIELLSILQQHRCQINARLRAHVKSLPIVLIEGLALWLHKSLSS